MKNPILNIHTILLQRITSLLFLLGSGSALVSPCVGAPFQFEVTGSLATARGSHTTTLLSDGKALVAGGQGRSSSLASAELYDPGNRQLDGYWQPRRRPP